MKRHKDLWNKIISYDNLYDAYLKARKGRRHLESIQRFEQDVEGNLKKLQQSLVSKTFKTSRYNTRTIFEPKERVIYILPFYPDRILQHALMNILAPIYQNKFIKDTYACIEGRGLHAGLVRAYEFAQKNKYCLKMDIKKFYPSIDHDTLYKIMEHKIKDPHVLWLLKDIIYSFPGDKNAPIGNLTSQWFGNIYLTELDYFIKQNLKRKYYIRYCDDFLVFGDSKQELNEIAEKVKHFLANNLKLKMSKCDLFHVNRGVDFLGYRYFKGYMLLRKRTARSIKKRVKKLYAEYDLLHITPEKMLSHLSSIEGYIRWANSYHFRLKIDIDKRHREIFRCFRIFQSLASSMKKDTFKARKSQSMKS